MDDPGDAGKIYEDTWGNITQTMEWGRSRIVIFARRIKNYSLKVDGNGMKSMLAKLKFENNS